jgi:putative aldouronate transport system permease protein
LRIPPARRFAAGEFYDNRLTEGDAAMKEKFGFSNGRAPRTLFVIFNYLLMTCIFVSVSLPLIKVLSDSFEGAFSYGFKLIPTKFDPTAYLRILSQEKIYTPFFVSVFCTVMGTLIGMLITTMSAYVLVQFDMPGRGILVVYIIITMVFSAGLIPTFLVVRDLGLVDTLWAPILLLVVNTGNIILMRNFFESVPTSLSEAAEIDGCSMFGIFYRIMLPLSVPAIATLSLFTFVAYWNEVMPFIYYINNPDLYNFQVILRQYVLSGDTFDTNTEAYIFPETLKNALIVISMVPVMCVYPFAQKYFVTGINIGAVKE